MKTYNVVVLWKQNDLRLYNRRVDSMVSALGRNPRVENIACVSAPVSYDEMALLQEDISDPTSDSKLRYMNIHQDYFGLRRHGACTYLNYLYSDYKASVFSEPLRGRSEYRFWLKEKLSDLKVLDNCILIVYPVVKEIEEVLLLNQWEYVVQDVVDDELQGHHDREELRNKFEKYLICKDNADLSIFSSNSRMESYRDLFSTVGNMRIFPNDFDNRIVNVLPADEAEKSGDGEYGFSQRVIGYIGDFGNRIDYELLQLVASEVERQNWTLLLVGPNIDKKILKKIERSENIHYLGPVRHEELRSIIARFDVGIIPHLINKTTDAMSPLKVFQYLQYRVPELTTRVKNIPEGVGVYVSGSREEFIANLHSASPDSIQIKDTYINKWDEYIQGIINLVDTRVESAREKLPEYVV